MRRALFILLPAAALVAIVAVWRLLLPACASLAPGQGLFGLCPSVAPPPARAQAADEIARGRTLEAEIEALQRELAARADCPPPAHRAALPPPQIDAERWEEGDVTLLDGCWSVDSDYRVRHRDSGEIVTVPFWRACFDAEGRGRQELRMSDGTTCDSGLTARFQENGALRLEDDGDSPCSGGRQLLKRAGDCTLGEDGRARCKLRDRYGETAVELRRER